MGIMLLTQCNFTSQAGIGKNDETYKYVLFEIPLISGLVERKDGEVIWFGDVTTRKLYYLRAANPDTHKQIKERFYEEIEKRNIGIRQIAIANKGTIDVRVNAHTLTVYETPMWGRSSHDDVLQRILKSYCDPHLQGYSIYVKPSTLITVIKMHIG